MTNNIIQFYAGESKPIDFLFARKLRPGQTVTSCTFEVESPATFVGGSTVIDGTGTIVQARFSIPAGTAAGTRCSVTAVAVCSNPTAADFRLPGVFVVAAVPE
jgi:hypothetical protein